MFEHSVCLFDGDKDRFAKIVHLDLNGNVNRHRNAFKY